MPTVMPDARVVEGVAALLDDCVASLTTDTVIFELAGGLGGNP